VNIPDTVAMAALDALGHASRKLDALTDIFPSFKPLASEVGKARDDMEAAVFSEDNHLRTRSEEP
jgi:hypothetical protein